MALLLPCFYAFLGSMGFCFIFNIHGKKLLFAAFGGAFGWLAYSLTGYIYPNPVLQYFVASIVISIYAETFARLHKVPAILYLVVALIPLVPGSGIYYTMEYCISGNTAEFMSVGLQTLSITGAIAMGVLVVSSCIRLYLVARVKNYVKKNTQPVYDGTAKEKQQE